jgi:GT2 family glycosyltransferase/SAM-dependent methyltransferase
MGDNDTPLRRSGARTPEGWILVRDTGSTYDDGVEEYVHSVLRGSSDLRSTNSDLVAHGRHWVEAYHVDPARANIVRGLDIAPDARVLEIGAGLGGVTRYLGERAALVDAIEPAPARARVARERTRDLPGVEVFVGDHRDVPAEPTYDVVVAVGVLEYVGQGSADHEPYVAFLTALQRALLPGGTLVVAIENKLGVKYLVGAPEDHTGKLFDSIEDYPTRRHARTFARRELEELFVAAGLVPSVRIAFPDYKLTRAVLDADALSAEAPGLLRDVPVFPSADLGATRPRLADEGRVWRSLVDAGLAADTGNSFLVLAGKDKEQSVWPADLAGVYYSRNRREAYAFEKRIERRDDGLVITSRRRGRKDPNAPLSVTDGRESYINGPTLQVAAERLSMPEAANLLRRWRSELFAHASTAEDVPLDFVPHNIVLCADGSLEPIDQEWTVRGWPLDRILRRGVLWFVLQLVQSTAPTRWRDFGSIRDVIYSFGAAVGLDRDSGWVDTAITEEAELQAEVQILRHGETRADAVARVASELTARVDGSLDDLPLGDRLPDVFARVQQYLEVSERSVAYLSGEMDSARHELQAARRAFLVAEARSESLLRERVALAGLHRQHEARAGAEVLTGPAVALFDAARVLEESRTWKLTRRLQRLGHPGRPDGLGAAAQELVAAADRVRDAARDGASIDAAGAAVDEAMVLVGRLRAVKTYRLARAIHALRHAAKLHADTPAVLDTVQAHLLELHGAINALTRVREEFRLESARKEAVVHEMFFPVFEHPEVSIVVPVHNQSLFTFTCLKAILLNTSGVDYEVIVVDDRSSDATEEMLASVHGLRSERHAVNRGFLESCMTGAEVARGKYLVFLNNDTVPLGGWLESLIQTFREHPDAGLVGPKFLNDDGTLQEAGGIVWRDGRAWNYGRGDDPERPEYNYLREVDYCSGACIAIPRELFFALGGFDSMYTPAYYEDTDLAMTVRRAGSKVLYQPRAEVVHFDGMTQRETGTKQYMERNAVLFRDKWLGLIKDRRAEGEAPDLEKDRGCVGRILVIDHYVPTPDQDAGSARMFGILAALAELGYKVTLAPDNLHRSQPYTAQLQALGVEVIYCPQVPDLRQYIRDTAGQFDWAILSRFQVAPHYIDLIRQVSPATRVMYDTVELGFVRLRRLAELSGSHAGRLEAENLRERELGLARRADVTLVVNEVERDVLRAEEPDIRVEVVSTIYRVRPARPGFEGRSGILFIGGFDHPPNGDAVVYFVEKILPLVRKHLPDVVFNVVGSRPRHDVLSLACDHVVVTGHVPNVDPYFESCRLSVAPLRYGAGVKGKINQSMAFGVPVVATTVAVEGMHLEHGSDVLVADDPAGFAEAVVAAYTDVELWARLSNNGLANVERHFSPERARAALSAILDSPPMVARV